MHSRKRKVKDGDVGQLNKTNTDVHSSPRGRYRKFTILPTVLADLLNEAQKLIWQAVLCAGGETEALGVLGDLGEVLMTSGNKREAELVLKSALRNENLPASVRSIYCS